MKKKLLSIITSVCLALSLTPVVALAEDSGTGDAGNTDSTNYVARIGETPYTSLSEAISTATDGDTVTLLNDVNATANTFISKSITLDLNNHTISSTGQSALCIYYTGDNIPNVTVTNGTLTGGTVCTVWAYNTANLKLENVTVTSADNAGGIYDYGTNSSLTLTNCEVSGDYFAIYHNGSTAPFTLTATDSVITAIEGSVSAACAIYVSGSSTNTTAAKNKIELIGCTVTGPTGVEGKYTDMTFTNCTIKATADVNFTQNNNGSTALGFAVVSTDNSVTPNDPSPKATIIINSGNYVGLIGLSHFEEATVSEEATYVVEGGNFSESVSDYVAATLTAELVSSSNTDTPYSYYADVTAAEAAAQPGDLIVDLSENANEVQILGVGFDATAAGANKAMTETIANLGGSNTVTDSDVNTMWAFLKLSDTASTYTLTVSKGTDTVYEETLQNASGRYYVYFTFNTKNGGSPAKQEIASGKYTVSLYTVDATETATVAEGEEETETETAIDTAYIYLSKVSFNLTSGTLSGGATLPEDTYYAAGSTIELPTPTRSGSYQFKGWYDGTGTYKGTYTVPDSGKDITLTDSWTYTGTSTPTPTTNPITVGSAENGTVTASPESAAAGDEVTLTVTPDEGYELDTITVTDAEGNTVSLTANEDGTYTFTMPETEVDVTATFKAAEAEHNCPSLIFTDVDLTQFYHEALDWAVVSKVTYGTTPTTFSPNEACTRGQMACFLWNLAGNPETSAACPFTDVDESAYYYKAVCWAAEKGVTYGTSPTTFSPEDTCTRGQMACFIWNYAGNPKTSASNPFADVEEGTFYYDAVRWAAETKVTYGTSETTFSPLGACTRAEMVCFLWNYQVGAATN